MSIADVVRKATDRAKESAGRLIRRGVVRAATATGFVQVSVGSGQLAERFDDVENWQQFGFTSRPPASSEVLVLLVDGNQDQAIAVAGTSRGDRPSLTEGDAAIYGTLSGSDQAAVKCHAAGGSVDLFCGTSEYVNVGGPTGAEPILLGTTVIADLTTFCNALGTAVPAAAAACSALVTAMASWPATKGRAA